MFFLRITAFLALFISFGMLLGLSDDLDNEEQYGFSTASCEFSSTGNACFITCEQGSYVQINEMVDSFWAEHIVCVTNGITLTLNNIQFDNATLIFDWFHINVNVTKLIIRYTTLTKVIIQQGALSFPAFHSLTDLTLHNIASWIFPKGALDNLDNLANLTISNSEIETFEKGFFDPIADQLQQLNITSYVTKLEPRSLANITENITLSSLETLQFRQNLNGSILKDTFSGCSNIIVLDLAQCNIEVIGPKSFDYISATLLHLILNDNQLKTLPAGLFSKFGGISRKVEINNNPWHCDCNLVEFKNNLQMHIFYGTIECQTPNCIAYKPVYYTEFCDRNGQGPCVDYIPPQIPPPMYSNRSNTIIKECYDDVTKSCEEIQIKGQTKIKNINKVENGLLFIEIDEEEDASDLVVVWFETVKTTDGNNEYYESSEEVSCQSSQSRQFRISGLASDTAYTVCLVAKSETTISPLDCMPYYNQTKIDSSDEDIWILEDDKIKVISFVVCGAVASLFFGIAVSFVFIRKNPTWLRGNDRVVRMSNDANSDVMVMPPEWSRQQSINNSHRDEKPRRFSDISTISGKSYIMSTNNANELFKRKIMEKRNSSHNSEKENKYYLDYMPTNNKIPPPLPPPNVPPLPPSFQQQQQQQPCENYYSDLAFKNKS